MTLKKPFPDHLRRDKAKTDKRAVDFSGTFKEKNETDNSFYRKLNLHGRCGLPGAGPIEGTSY